jgi:HEAT repeat protein
VYVHRAEDLDVREAAARALGHLSDERAIEPLRGLLDDEEEQAREAARTSLENIERAIAGGRR